MKCTLRKHHGIEYYRIWDGNLLTKKWYILNKTYRVQTKMKGRKIECGNFITLYPNGVLVIERGYVWDGPSGIAIPTKNFMRGSLVHDAFYQCLRAGVFMGYVWWVSTNDGRRPLYKHEDIREFSDALLAEHCREDGMAWIRSQWVYAAVQLAGKSSARRGAKWAGDKKLKNLKTRCPEYFQQLP